MSYNHLPGLHVSAIFDPTHAFRYQLEIVQPAIPPPGRTVCVVMQNPSVASEHSADKSVQFLEKLVFQRSLPEFQGVRRLVIVNQFARIQTTGFQGRPADIGPENDAILAQALQEAEVIVLAWGAANRFTARQELVYRLLGQMPGKQIYRTRRHPSRGSYQGLLVPFSSPSHPTFWR